MTNTAKSAPSRASFSELIKNSALISSLSEMGFQEATLAQELSIPTSLKGKDLVLHAKTGSGKTLAFGLPMLSKLFDAREKGEVKGTFGLVITPTRELAAQIADVLTGLLPDTEPVLLIGGMSIDKQKKALKKNSEIVIGTPGRIIDLLDRGDLSFADCKFFVLDEADEMFSMGFYDDILDLLSEIPKVAQGLFVSATISPRIEALAREYLHDPEFVEAGSHEDETPPLIDHLYCMVGQDLTDKPNALCDFIEVMEPKSAIIFCNTRSDTELVEVYLRRRGYDARRINSDLNQSQRNTIMKKIKDHELRFLIATDIAARGIDIALMDLVINYSLSDDTESYVHRTGRTGRAGRHGTALTLISPNQFMAFQGVKREVDLEFVEVPVPKKEELVDAILRRLESSVLSTSAGTPAERERYQLIAKALLEKEGVDPIEPLSKLVQFALEHQVRLDAESLDQELQTGSEKRSEPHRDRRKHGSDDRRNNRSHGKKSNNRSRQQSGKR